MNNILSEFIATLNSAEENLKNINNNNCEYLKISYEDYKQINPKLDNVLYICDDAINSDEAKVGVSGTGGIIPVKGKVFKGKQECSPKDKNESLIEIAMRNGYNGNEYSKPNTNLKPMFESYITVDKSFEDIPIDARTSGCIYLKLDPVECRIWSDGKWQTLFKKMINNDDLGDDINEIITNIADIVGKLKALAFVDEVPIATSKIAGAVKSGKDISVDSDGNVSINDDNLIKLSFGYKNI